MSQKDNSKLLHLIASSFFLNYKEDSYLVRLNNLSKTFHFGVQFLLCFAKKKIDRGEMSLLSH